MASDGTNSVNANFNVTPSIIITPITGLNGIPVSISGNGFAANSNLLVTFNGVTVSPSPSNPSTDLTGTFSNLAFTAQSTAPGPKTVTVTDAAGNSANAPFTLMFNPTVPIPTLNPLSLTFGNSLTSSVTVSGVGGVIPTGTVTFQVSTDGGNTWNPFGAVKTLNGGSGTSDPYTPQSTSNNYQIRVVYNGDSNYASATSLAATVTVNQANPTVSVPTFTPLSPITLGASMTSKITVTGVLGVIPTGTVTFQVSTDSGNTWTTFGGIKTLISGFTTSDPYIPQTAGNNYQFKGMYSGDSNYDSVIGAAGTLTVNKGTASVSASTFTPVSPVTLSSSVTVSTTVSAPSGVTTTPSGTIQFQVKIGSNSFANFGSPVSLTSGSTSISYTPSNIGTYSFQAIYQGDNNYNSGTTGAASGTLTIYIPSSTGTLLSASSPLTLGGSTTDTATVTPQTYLNNQVTFIGAGNGVSGTSAVSVRFTHLG